MCRAHLPSCVLKKKKKVSFFFPYLSVFILGDFLQPLEIHLLSEWKRRCEFFTGAPAHVSLTVGVSSGDCETHRCLQGTNEQFGVDATAQAVTVPEHTPFHSRSGCLVTSVESS